VFFRCREMAQSSTIGYHQFLMEEAHHHVGGGEAVREWNWTSAGNGTVEEEPYEGPEWLVVPLVFGLIFIVGVVGNGTLIFTVLVNKNMRTTPNVLLVSLAVGDPVNLTWSLRPGYSDMDRWYHCHLVSTTLSV